MRRLLIVLQQDKSGRTTTLKIARVTIAIIVAAAFVLGMKELRNAFRREEAYQQARQVFMALDAYYYDPSNRRSFPSPSGSRDMPQNWRRSLLEYSAGGNVLSRDSLKRAYTYGGTKCALFAIVDDEGEWVSGGIQDYDLFDRKRPLLANIAQKEFDWDENVDVRAATESELTDSSAKVYVASAVMYDTRNME